MRKLFVGGLELLADLRRVFVGAEGNAVAQGEEVDFPAPLLVPFLVHEAVEALRHGGVERPIEVRV
jgi:hypothetical protein